MSIIKETVHSVADLNHNDSEKIIDLRHVRGDRPGLELRGDLARIAVGVVGNSIPSKEYHAPGHVLEEHYTDEGEVRVFKNTINDNPVVKIDLAARNRAA
ncbi:hypothetical protein KBD20_01285 [Candidatus Saccharibacteria bacterium]|nr:hypothetical protein [Candidatus Saccharibacteria bacterium]